jgi:hypothetical protein
VDSSIQVYWSNYFNAFLIYSVSVTCSDHLIALALMIPIISDKCRVWRYLLHSLFYSLITSFNLIPNTPMAPCFQAHCYVLPLTRETSFTPIQIDIALQLCNRIFCHMGRLTILNWMVASIPRLWTASNFFVKERSIRKKVGKLIHWNYIFLYTS